jgi:hypothetical protein
MAKAKVSRSDQEGIEEAAAESPRDQSEAQMTDLPPDIPKAADFASGWYVDRHGRRWFCVPRTNSHCREKSMSCNSDDGGYFTSAFFSTFAIWGWKPE